MPATRSSSNVYERAGTQLGMTPNQYRRGGRGVAITYAVAETTLGLMVVGATDRGICFVRFGDSADALANELRREYPSAAVDEMRSPHDADFETWIAALRRHLAGRQPHVDLPLDVRATAFQLVVWTYLQSIPYGEVTNRTRKSRPQSGSQGGSRRGARVRGQRSRRPDPVPPRDSRNGRTGRLSLGFGPQAYAYRPRSARRERRAYRRLVDREELAVEHVATFRALHAQTRVLVLPNAWDVASAILFVSAGATAIATTSAGLAWSCGFPDGDALPREALLLAVAAILRACPSVPVSVDLEGGYSGDPGESRSSPRNSRLWAQPESISRTVTEPRIAGAKIEAVKRRTGIFVNARADVYLRELAHGDDAVAESVARAKRYALAGADGIFVPGIAPEAIATLAQATPAAARRVGRTGLPAFAELYGLGVRRISAGSGLAKLAYGDACAAATAFLGGESAALFSGGAVPYAEMNALAARHQSRPGSV